MTSLVLPPREEDETYRAHYRRVWDLYEAIDSHLPVLVRDALDEATRNGQTQKTFIDRMPFQRSAIEADRESTAIPTRSDLLPLREAGEDAGDYYARMRQYAKELKQELKSGEFYEFSKERTGTDEAPAELPSREPGETAVEYHRRIVDTLKTVRGYLTQAIHDAAAEGERWGILKGSLAVMMGIYRTWLHKKLRDEPGPYDEDLLPPQEADEDAIEYYVRLRKIRDVLTEELNRGELSYRAMEEARAAGKVTNTQIAAAAGYAEGHLTQRAKRFARDSGLDYPPARGSVVSGKA